MDQKKVLSFLSVWVVITLVCLILSVVLSGNLVLGNMNLTKPVSGLLFGLVLTIVFFATGPAISKIDIKIKDERVWIAIFFIANAFVIWVLKRLATLTGIGISNIFFVAIIAAVVTLTEKTVDKYSQKTFGKK